MARGLFLAVVLSLCLTAPARAGEAFISVDGSDVAYLHFEDPAGVPDEIRIPPTAERTITLLGPTVVAGDGCVPVAGGASCTRPSRAHVWERTIIDTGGGDDTVVVETSHQMRIFGNDGNDRISLGPQTIGEVSGGDGDDVLATAASAILFGGAGNDHLSAGARSGLSGDAGADRLEGSPQDDVLVDAGDRGSRDVLACNGGADVMQIDETDALEGCTSAAFDKISRTKFYWEVRYGPRVSIPTLLRVRDSKYFGDIQSLFAQCIGAPCRGAKFEADHHDYKQSFTDLRIVRGGKRVRFEGRWWRGVSPGAIVRVGLSFELGNVRFTKGWEFRTRARKVPIRRKRCTVAILAYPRARGPGREVPCT